QARRPSAPEPRREARDAHPRGRGRLTRAAPALPPNPTAHRSRPDRWAVPRPGPGSVRSADRHDAFRDHGPKSPTPAHVRRRVAEGDPREATRVSHACPRGKGIQVNAVTDGLRRGRLFRFKTVRAKLLSAFAVVTVLTLVLGLFALQQMGKIFSEVEAAHNVTQDATNHVVDLTESALLVRVSALKLTIAADPAVRTTVEGDIAALDKTFAKNLAGLKGLPLTAAAQRERANVEKNWGIYTSARDQLLIPAANSGNLP